MRPQGPALPLIRRRPKRVKKTKHKKETPGEEIGEKRGSTPVRGTEKDLNRETKRSGRDPSFPVSYIDGGPKTK